jgi:hypothetical protein
MTTLTIQTLTGWSVGIQYTVADPRAGWVTVLLTLGRGEISERTLSKGARLSGSNKSLTLGPKSGSQIHAKCYLKKGEKSSCSRPN